MKQIISTTLKRLFRVIRSISERRNDRELNAWTKETGEQLLAALLAEPDPNQFELFTAGKGE